MPPLLSFHLFSNLCSVIPAFKAAAEELLHTSELSPAELLAKALAKAAVCISPHYLSDRGTKPSLMIDRALLLLFQGYSEIKSRSLLSSMENCVTLLLECGRPIFSPS